MSISVPNLKFLASTVREILGGPKIRKFVKWPPHDPLWQNFEFFSLELTVVHLRAKFEVSSFNRSRDIKGVPKFQNWVTLPPHDPFWPNFKIFSLELTALTLCAKFEVFSFNVHEILGGSQNSKIVSRDPHMTPFDPILNFFSLELTDVHLRTKFEVSSFNLPEILGGSQNFKIGSHGPNMTQFDPILHFFRYYSPPSVSVPNLKFLASTVPGMIRGLKIPKLEFNRSRDIRGSQNSKIWSRGLNMTPFDPILHFFH